MRRIHRLFPSENRGDQTENDTTNKMIRKKKQSIKKLKLKLQLTKSPLSPLTLQLFSISEVRVLSDI